MARKSIQLFFTAILTSLTSLFLQSCSLFGSILDRALADTPSTYTGKKHRWIFADDADKEELQLKQETLEKIDSFWKAFKLDESKLTPSSTEVDVQFLTTWFNQHLKPIDDYIMWEIGPGKGEQPNILTLTAETHTELRPVIDTIIDKAPDSENWKFQKYRERLPNDLIETAIESKGGFKLQKFSSQCKISEANKIDIIFSSPSFKGNDDLKDLGCCFLLCEAVLGEENLDKWLGTIRTQIGEDSLETEQAAEKLAEQFAGKQDEILKGLPDDCYYTLKEPEKTAVIKIRSGRFPQRVTIVTTNIPLSQALLTKSFYSERYSKNGERFCVLAIDSTEDYVLSEESYKFIDLVDSKLRESEFGCVVSTGRGPQSIFIDLCLKNTEQARELLSGLCKSNNMPKTAWLFFYDSDWVNEWIGMYEDTKRE